MFSELHSYIFFFNDSSTTNIYTLSLHDALPIYFNGTVHFSFQDTEGLPITFVQPPAHRQFTTSASQIRDRKSTRLNSSHPSISYAVFCLKKKKIITTTHHHQPLIAQPPRHFAAY